MSTIFPNKFTEETLRADIVAKLARLGKINAGEPGSDEMKSVMRMVFVRHGQAEGGGAGDPVPRGFIFIPSIGLSSSSLENS